MNDGLRSVLLSIACIGFLVFCVTDCTVGRKRFCRGQVRQHLYHPPYSTLSCEQTNHGTVCHSTYHPASYRLLIGCESPAHAANINAGMTDFARYRDGDRVLVGERLGRWTGYIWLDWIEKADPNQRSDDRTQPNQSY